MAQAMSRAISALVPQRVRRHWSFAVSMLARPIRSFRMLGDESLEVAFPPYRRHAKRVTGVVTSLAVLVAVGLVVGLVTSTPLVTAAAVLALAMMVVAAAWDRRRNGSTSLVRQGHPPGELTRLACPLLEVDHHRDFVTRHGPVFTTNHLHTPVVAIYGLERGQDVLRRCEADLGPMPRPDHDLVEGGFVRVLEGDEHRRMRATLAPLFGAAVMRRVRPGVESHVDVLIAGWEDAGAGAPVHPRPLVEALVLDVWLTLFFGASADFDRDRLDRLTGLYRQIDHLYPTPEMRLVQDRIVDEVRALGKRPDLPDCLLKELVTRSPELLDDLTVVENLVHLVTSTHADMTGLFHWMTKFLADNPAWAERLRNAGPEERQTLSDAFVSECLRLAQSEVLLRYTKRPIDVEGHRVPERWMLRVLVRESHRDPEVFEDPLGFSPDRFLSRSYGRLEYAPFGLDGRSCIGEILARMAGGVFVERLAERFDIETCEDGPLQLSVHRHVAPNHHWTVRFRAAERTGTQQLSR